MEEAFTISVKLSIRAAGAITIVNLLHVKCNKFLGE